MMHDTPEGQTQHDQKDASGQSLSNGGLAANPEDCVCEPLSWFGQMKPICNDYHSDEGSDQCRRCEHDKGCHKAANVKSIESALLRSPS